MFCMCMPYHKNTFNFACVTDKNTPEAVFLSIKLHSASMLFVHANMNSLCYSLMAHITLKK